ncbi:MAG: hypothetical protein COB04_18395 [Gammaproteobacteria bacterium]|nr:MAG: hypothetical protein COB04_18395 [Gammaproteobacteria bacterium]
MALPLPNLNINSNPYAGPSGNTGGIVGGNPTFNIKDDFFDQPSWSKYLNGGSQGGTSPLGVGPVLSASIGPWPVLVGLLIMAGMYLFKKGG